MQKTGQERKKYYWSPSVRWERVDDKIRIEMFVYNGIALEIFPEFYFLTYKGITLNELSSKFSGLDIKRLNIFIEDLIKKKILVSSILSPNEIFYPQNRLFNNQYSDRIMYDVSELKKYKDEQLDRTFENCKDEKIILGDQVEYPPFVANRRTCRDFDKNKKISFEKFSELLSILKQIKINDSTTYYYASAGGLYPIDVFVYVKANRVENIDQGIYYYSPVYNSLSVVNDKAIITNDAHYLNNKPIFDSSAFSIFLVYNARANMPKYGGMGYYYACIDCGVMIGTFTQVAEFSNMGICSIGDMDYRMIEKYFNLNENQVFLHTIEVGLKS